jgi:hypothetical protein
VSRKHKNRVTKHHRKPVALGGLTTKENISHVTHKRHNAWHTLFGAMTIEEIVEQLNDVWIDPEYKVKLERR